MPRRKEATTIYLEPEQLDALRVLTAQTKVPMSEYIRHGIDMALKAAAESGLLPGVTIAKDAA